MAATTRRCSSMRSISSPVSGQEAIDFTRVFPGLDDPAGRVQVEPGLPAGVLAELQALGHETYVPARPIGGAQAIWIDWQQGVLRGASEPRKDGCAIGY